MKHPMADGSQAIVTGLPVIDGQHKELFDMAASFRGEGDQIRVMHTLSRLVEYANTHLKDEETMLAALGYPGLDGHRLHHHEFRRLLRQLHDEARNLTLDQIADRIEDLINGWFYQHILTVDATYVGFVKALSPRPAA